MNKAEILDFIKANDVASLATVEGNKPHVRAIGTYRADENGLIFFTQKTKDFYKQVAKNPEVECCYRKEIVTVRVCGKLQPVEDMALKKEIAEKNGFLKPGIDKEGWDYLKVFALKNGKAYVYKIGDPPAPKTYVTL